MRNSEIREFGCSDGKLVLQFERDINRRWFELFLLQKKRATVPSITCLNDEQIEFSGREIKIRDPQIFSLDETMLKDYVGCLIQLIFWTDVDFDELSNMENEITSKFNRILRELTHKG